MCDNYRGDAWPIDKALDGEFGKWFGKIITPEFWAQVLADFAVVVEDLKSKGFEKIGIIGFCWGGKAVSLAAASESLGLSCAVSLHGVAHSGEDIKQAQCPLYYLKPADDPYFPADKAQEIVDALADSSKAGGLKIFEGVSHGWTNRGDYDDPEVKAKADEALNDTLSYLGTHLL
eukprot:CAMPEP_0174276740 /NCGR_PEP_ID=MMETSP0439-20130205/60552_1 /TAXON_ID=0 /ORGANISM="Stereomyxa ramosa, Strain Chinc5" /LENGTH=174 /DNA_ID=CAMNT_0015369003 /DNA_START=1023 /DNA_END=1547 /DNA_ORIENTATION=+